MILLNLYPVGRMHLQVHLYCRCNNTDCIHSVPGSSGFKLLILCLCDCLSTSDVVTSVDVSFLDLLNFMPSQTMQHSKPRQVEACMRRSVAVSTVMGPLNPFLHSFSTFIVVTAFYTYHLPEDAELVVHARCQSFAGSPLSELPFFVP